MQYSECKVSGFEEFSMPDCRMWIYFIVIAREAKPTAAIQGNAGNVLTFPWIATADKQPPAVAEAMADRRDDKVFQSSI